MSPRKQMPRACPVEHHDFRYTRALKNHAWMPRACPVEAHVRSYVALNGENSTGQARGISANA